MSNAFPPPVIFCRHGQTDWNKERRLQGLTDIPLNEHGEGQAAHYGRTLEALDKDWSEYDFFYSPRMRTQKTLEIIFEHLKLPLDIAKPDERLLDLNLGDWCGMRIPDIEQEYKEEWVARKQNPWNHPVPGNGENYASAAPRITEFVSELKRPSLIVGHGATGRLLRGILTKNDPKLFIRGTLSQDEVHFWQPE